MKGKRTITLLGFVCVFAFVLSIPMALVAGGKDEPAHAAGGTWLNVDSDGTISIATTALTNTANGHSWTISMDLVNFDYRFELFPGFYLVPDAAPVQDAGKGDGFLTAPDKIDNFCIWYVRNQAGEIAYIMVSKGKGRILDDNTLSFNYSLHIFISESYGGAGWIDANGDSVPDDDTGALLIPGQMMCYRLSKELSSFAAPDEYPPKP